MINISDCYDTTKASAHLTIFWVQDLSVEKSRKYRVCCYVDAILAAL